LAKGLSAENLRAGAAALLAHEAPSAEPELCLVRDALIGLVLLPGDGQTVGSWAEPETGNTVGSEAEPEPSLGRNAPSGLVLLPSDEKTVGSEAEPESGLVQEAPSGLVLMPGDGKAVGSEAEAGPV
jgi:hypothetical protein